MAGHRDARFEDGRPTHCGLCKTSLVLDRDGVRICAVCDKPPPK